MGHRYTALLAAAFTFAANIPKEAIAQNLVTNGAFEDGSNNFDITGWNWFCSVPEYFPSGDACNGSWSLSIPPNDSLSACFSNGELVGLHTHLTGLQVGVPYELTFCEKVDPVIGGDVGIFAVPAGQTPTNFSSTTFIYAWPVFGIPNQWVQDIDDFTVPLAYAGMDFYLFIEYSAAPDVVPSPKYFDSFSVVAQSGLGIVEADEVPLSVSPSPASDLIHLGATANGSNVDVVNVTGRVVMQVVLSPEHAVDVADLPVGIYFVRVGDRIARFVKQ